MKGIFLRVARLSFYTWIGTVWWTRRGPSGFGTGPRHCGPVSLMFLFREPRRWLQTHGLVPSVLSERCQNHGGPVPAFIL